MIKGHTKIELTNVRTGEKKVVEDDNLVTNAIKYFLKNPLCPPIDNTYVGDNPTISDADKWFGGLLLFHDTIEEDADNCLIPTDNQMIGNARVNYASASGVPEFGAYNSEESAYTIQDGKITRKFVYDFGTSKGNGTISCVALTNIHAGYWGAGNTSGKYEALNVDGYNYGNESTSGSPISDYSIYNYKNSRNACYLLDANGDEAIDKQILFIDYDTNTMYFIDKYNIVYNSSYKDKHFTTTGKLRLYKAYYPLKSYNPLSIATIEKNRLYNIRTYRIYDYVDITVPDELKTYNSNITYDYCNPSVTNDGIWLVFYNKSTKLFMCWFISADLKTTKYVNVKNTAGTISLTSYFGNTKYRSIVIYKNYLLGYYNSSNNIKLYAINMNNNTDVFEFKLFNTYNTSAYNFTIIGDQLFLCHYRNISAIDIKNKVVKPINATHLVYSDNVGYDHNTFLQICGTDKQVLWTQDATGYIACMQNVYPNVFMLSTINNLPEPVTKTNDMTMKITYTLTSDL